MCSSSLLGNKSLSKVTNAEITTVANTIATQYATGLGAEKASQIGKTYAALLTTWRDTYVGNVQLLELSQGNLKAIGLTEREGRKSGQKFKTDRLLKMIFIDKSITGMYERRYKISGLENSCS